jgi:hypothetical protein
MDGSPPGVFVITGKRCHPTTALGGAEEPTIAESATADDKYGDELADVSLHASPTPFNRVLSTQPTKSPTIHASLEPIQQVPSTIYQW